ncbi:MAG: alanine racemase [Alphaproteobacteria bacterium]|nr:alanine racemase [Alphaproteobacteria bacterium]
MNNNATGILTIDLDAIAANYRFLSERARPAVTAAAIKANAYGLGVGPVSRTLWAEGCRDFFVATIDEGIELRGLLPEARITVLNGLIAGDPALFRKYALIPALNDLGQIDGWRADCQRNGPAPAVLHLDTGMARLGLPPAELNILADDHSRLDGIALALIMTHLACADEPDDTMTRRQRDNFAAALARLPRAPASLSASSGIFHGPDYLFDMVRPGVCLHGLNPRPGHPNPLRPVVRLQAKILQIRDVDTPQTVGYGASHRVAGPARLATLAAGYADGYLRSLSGRGTAYMGETAVPIVGRVSMDLTTVDITRVPEARPGDMVDLIGPRHDVDALAEEAGTIGYEILTSLGRRYHRHYLGERCGEVA